MGKSKALRFAGFVGALCATGALVATAVEGTGAYFSASKAGTLSASSGALTLSTSNTTLNYANLMPGDNVTKNVTYNVHASSGKVDVWLVFNHDGSGYEQFTGGKGSTDAPDGGLGRYGYFKVDESHWGTAFQTGNLAFPTSANDTQSAGNCPTDATTGRGGNTWIATASDPMPTQWCGVPAAIELVGGLSSGQSGTISVTFGLNGYLQTQQGQAEPTVGFTIVATQAGHSPVNS